MKTSLRYIFAALSLGVVLAFTGCDKDSAKGFAFDSAQVSAGVVQQDSVEVNGQLVVLTPEMAALVDPAKVVKAGTPLMQEQLTPKPYVTGAIAAVKYLPIPGADIISYALNGLLAISAAWLARGKKTSDKIAVSMVKGVDTFRDILDQTQGGAKLDGYLTEALQREQSNAQVLSAVRALLDRYETPAKPAASQLTSEALKS